MRPLYKTALLFVGVALISPSVLAQRAGIVRPAQAEAETAASTMQPLQSPPILGFIYRPEANQIRTMFGIVGAARLGDPIALPTGVSNLRIAPGQQCALVEGRNGAAGLITLTGSEPGRTVELRGAMARPDIVSFSPNGHSAALYSRSEALIQVIAGLPHQPRLSGEITRAELPDEIGVLALADDGASLLAGTVNNSVFFLDAASTFSAPGPPQAPLQPMGSWARMLLAGPYDGFGLPARRPSTPRFVYRAGQLGGLVFGLGSDNALVFESDRGAATLLENVTNRGYSRPLVDGLTALQGSILLWLDRSRALVTSTDADELWQVRFDSHQVQAVRLPTKPSTLQALRTPGKYLLSGEPGQPAWIVDTREEIPGISFIPGGTETPVSAAVRVHSPGGGLPVKVKVKSVPGAARDHSDIR